MRTIQITVQVRDNVSRVTESAMRGVDWVAFWKTSFDPGECRDGGRATIPLLVVGSLPGISASAEDEALINAHGACTNMNMMGGQRN